MSTRRPKKLKVMFLTSLLLCSMIAISVAPALSAEAPMTQGDFVILITRILGYEKEISLQDRQAMRISVYVELLYLKGILPLTLASSIMAKPEAPLTAGVKAVILAKALKLDIAGKIKDPSPQQYSDYLAVLREMDIPIPADPNALITRKDAVEEINTPSILFALAELYKVPASPIAP